MVDSSHQALALQLMVLGPEDVCKVRNNAVLLVAGKLIISFLASQMRFGELTENSIQVLRILRDAFGVIFKIKTDRETNTVLLSCLGTGYKNMARKIA